MLQSMTSTSTTCPIEMESSLLAVRRALRSASTEVGLGLVAETKLVTAASELARNILRYADHGSMTIEHVERQDSKGLRARFEDGGPGIEDIDLAMQDNYTSGGGLGMGLPGARRLCDEFEIESESGRGTIVTITQWAR